MTLFEYKECSKDNCKRCVHQYKNRCYCDKGCQFRDINPDGLFREVKKDECVQ